MPQRFPVSRYREAYLAAARILGGDEKAAARDFELVVACGSQPARHFHHLGHFIDVSSAADSAHALRPALVARGLSELSDTVGAWVLRAGAHHDLAYTQVDGGIPDVLADTLAPFLKDDGSLKTLSAIDPAWQPLMRRTLTVFGREPRMPLDEAGGNEFLSALAAGVTAANAGIAPRHALAETAVIEATVPFLSRDRMARSAERLAAANKALPEGERLSEDESHAAMLGAVQLANHDVAGFHGAYIDFHMQSDRLLSEQGFPQETEAEQRSACEKQIASMERLRRIASSGGIFHAYDGFPSERVLAEWHARAAHNIDARRRDCRRQQMLLDGEPERREFGR